MYRVHEFQITNNICMCVYVVFPCFFSSLTRPWSCSQTWRGWTALLSQVVSITVWIIQSASPPCGVYKDTQSLCASGSYQTTCRVSHDKIFWWFYHQAPYGNTFLLLNIHGFLSACNSLQKISGKICMPCLCYLTLMLSISTDCKSQKTVGSRGQCKKGGALKLLWYKPRGFIICAVIYYSCSCCVHVLIVFSNSCMLYIEQFLTVYGTRLSQV